MEGLWYTHFTAGPVNGDGLVVLRSGEILGGDPTRTYSGSYNADGSIFYANVRVSPRATPSGPPELEHPISIFFKGSIIGNSVKAVGHPDHHSEVEVAVDLERP